MSMVDFFNTDSFNMVSLTNALVKLPHKPGRIGKMGLFKQKGSRTNTIILEEIDGLLQLLPTRTRGGPATVGKKNKRTVRSLVIPHIPFEDTILAEDVEGVRAFGSENAFETVAKVVNDKLATMKASFDVTWEHLMAGALQGIVLDADGSTVITNLFTEFDVTEGTVDFLLGTSTTDIRGKCLEVLDLVEEALGAGTYEHVHALCGKTIFRALIAHADVENAYDRWRDSAFLRSDPRSGFDFAGVIFEEYHGTVSGVDFIPTDEMRFFPVGVPNLFVTHFGPADFIETVNTIGIPMYAKQKVMEWDRGVQLHTQSNPLPICHQPAVLVKGHTSD